jgi:glycosyltransferase involved in cell wall biosynthesis
MGHTVTLLAGAPRFSLRAGSRTVSGVEVITPPGVEPQRLRRSGLSALDIAGRTAMLRAREFHLIHAFGHRPSSWYPTVLSGRGSPPRVADWADWYGSGGIARQRGWFGRVSIGGLDTWLEARRARWASAFTVATHDLARMANALGFPESRILNIRNGASVDTIFPLPKEAARSKLGLPLAVPIVLHAGRSAWDRRDVLATFDEVARLHPGACLVLVGQTGGAAAGWAARKGWQGRLLEIPHVAHERLGEVLACGDVMLLPLPPTGMNLGRFPARAGDYMAAGRPMVTNPTGELGDFVQSAGAGLVVAADPSVMAQAVVTLLTDPALAGQLGESGRRAAETQLAWPRLATQVMCFYESLLAAS